MGSPSGRPRWPLPCGADLQADHWRPAGEGKGIEPVADDQPAFAEAVARNRSEHDAGHRLQDAARSGEDQSARTTILPTLAMVAGSRVRCADQEVVGSAGAEAEQHGRAQDVHPFEQQIQVHQRLSESTALIMISTRIVMFLIEPNRGRPQSPGITRVRPAV